ncbi:hypothetical protein RJ639_010110 [Escallonia herrerae]|uniref:Growth-regulating factor n=1 Tax=Escallonia herrerae TaxID=1293975 RepID=A0AA89AQL0_9ASTE|nr:hypothetical protein RJ639_010110 [Escallonia herrerae]
MGGYGRKVDPEPGRCRRTDGKKWRCSKEAYPDSKYCERHMHRGRNRSRKPVEIATTSSFPIFNPSSPSFSLLSQNTQDSTIKHTSPSSHHNSLLYPSPFPPPSSTKPLPNNTTHQLFLDSRSYPLSDKAHRYLLQMREGEHGAAFRPEASGTRGISLIHDSNTATALTAPSSDDYSSQLSFQSLFHRPKFEEQTKQDEEKEQHCFVLGTDFKSAASSKSIICDKVGIGGEETKMKPFHHFLGNCPPRESRDYPPWQVHDIEEEKQQTKNASFETQIALTCLAPFCRALTEVTNLSHPGRLCLPAVAVHAPSPHGPQTWLEKSMCSFVLEAPQAPPAGILGARCEWAYGGVDDCPEVLLKQLCRPAIRRWEGDEEVGPLVEVGHEAAADEEEEKKPVMEMERAEEGEGEAAEEEEGEAEKPEAEKPEAAEEEAMTEVA